jgi:hypothetical protein
MKKTLLLAVMAAFLTSAVFAQKKNKKNAETASTEVAQGSSVGATVTKIGIYEAEIGATSQAFEVAPGTHTVPVSLEEGVSAPEGEITVGFVKGFLEPDYIVNPEDSSTIVAYVAVAESLEEENQAIRFISFDEHFIDIFQKFAVDRNQDANRIILYGLEMNVETGSIVVGAELNPSGDPIPSFLLVGVSLEEIDNPAIVLVAGDLIRPNAKQTLEEYAPESLDVARMAKVTGIGYEEMKERSNIDETLLPYLQKKEFMKVRSLWSEEQDKSSKTSEARLVSSRNVNKQLSETSSQRDPRSGRERGR